MSASPLPEARDHDRADELINRLYDPQADHRYGAVLGSCGCPPCQIRNMRPTLPLSTEDLLRAMRLVEGGHA